jgi:hypothetical protein
MKHPHNWIADLYEKEGASWKRYRRFAKEQKKRRGHGCTGFSSGFRLFACRVRAFVGRGKVFCA